LTLTFVYFEAEFQNKTEKQYTDDAREYMYLLWNTITNNQGWLQCTPKMWTSH